ncbi:MAG: sugar phosphate isomerase/epimerase family protein [Pirellulales bacterium]
MHAQSHANLPDRRQWLGRTASVAAAGTLAAMTSLAAPSPARAIEPIARNGKSKFKFSLAAYSYRDLLTGKPPKLTLADFIDDCAKFGLEGTELTSYYFPPQPTGEYLRDLKRQCFRLGIDVSGTAVGNDFCHPPGERRDKEIAGVKRWIEHAEVLGAPVIRIFSGNAKSGQSAEQAHKLAVAGMEECCEYAGQHGVTLALENHGGLTSTVDGMLALIRDVKSPWFGVNVDTGNFRTADPYGDLAKIAPYAVNVQVKVVIHPQGGQREASDFGRLAKILREAGYRGYVALEFEEKGDPRAECEKYLDQLRSAFA